MNWARQERRALADLLTTLGPDAPTLDEGWTSGDLAAHLVIRDRRPDAALGLFVPALAPHAQKVSQEIRSRPWAEVVELVRSGPPPWSPAAFEPIDGVINTVEYFVHHEDVRRAQAGWEPRPVDGDLEHELWRRLKPMARLLVRRCPTGLVLRRPNGEEVVAKKPADDGVTAVVTGPPSELLLFAYGRQSHARVEVTAPADVAQAVTKASFGI